MAETALTSANLFRLVEKTVAKADALPKGSQERDKLLTQAAEWARLAEETEAREYSVSEDMSAAASTLSQPPQG